MSNYTFSMQRLLNNPLMMTSRHAAMVVAAIHSRFDFSSLRMGDEELNVSDLSDLASSGRMAALETRHKRNARTKIYEQTDSIATIPVWGTLTKNEESMDPESGMTGYNRIEQKIALAQADPEVKACWLDVDSGGGEVNGCFGLADFIYRSSARFGGKPIIAMAADHAYSAAYLIAAAADHVIVPPTGGVGSVGVLALHADESQHWRKEGINITVLRAGKDKAKFNRFEPLEASAAAHVQGQIDKMRDMFIEKVALYRGIDEKIVRETEGLDYMGEDSRAIGFVNEVMWEQEAFAELLLELRKSA